MVALRVKAVWSSVRVVPGVLSVMMLGELMMPLWSVDSWDLLKSVCFVVFLHSLLHYSLFNGNDK